MVSSQMYFQHDGAPPHYTRHVREYLNESFPNRWLGRGGPPHPLLVDISLWRCTPTRAMASGFLRFLHHTQRRTTVGRSPLDMPSARRRDLYPTTQNNHKRQTSLPRRGSNHNLSRWEAADLCLRPHGHWDRLLVDLITVWPSADNRYKFMITITRT